MNLDRAQQSSVAFALVPIMIVWQINGIYMAALGKVSIPLFWLADLGQWIVLPGVVLVLLARRASVFPAHYGLGTSALRWQSPILGTLGVFVTSGLAFTFVRNILWHMLGQPKGFFSFGQVMPEGLLGQIVLLYSAITAGAVESIFFIGLPWLLYRHVRVEPSRTAFAFLASIVFAVAHWEQGPHVVVGAFASNLVSCIWFFKLGTLWPVAAGHALVDVAALS